MRAYKYSDTRVVAMYIHLRIYTCANTSEKLYRCKSVIQEFVESGCIGKRESEKLTGDRPSDVNLAIEIDALFYILHTSRAQKSKLKTGRN